MFSSGSTPSFIEHCRFLELPQGTNYTENIVSCTASELTPSNEEIKERLIKEDIACCRSAALEHASLRYFNHICQNSSWMALWDAALKHGTKGTSQTLALLRAFSQPIFGNRRCPLQQLEGKENCIVPPGVAVLEHFHTEHNITNTKSIVTSVENRHSTLFSYDEQLCKLFNF